jgi:arginine exporter protein ArgO
VPAATSLSKVIGWLSQKWLIYKYTTHYVMLCQIGLYLRVVLGTFELEILQLTQTSHYWLYFVLVAGIIVLPGMDMAFVMASSLVDGRKAGAAAVAGIVMGGVIHVLMSALGVGLLLVSAPRLFNGLLILGSLYVAWMGGFLIHGATALSDVKSESPRSTLATFFRALTTCLLNPKAYVSCLPYFHNFCVLNTVRSSFNLRCSVRSLR